MLIPTLLQALAYVSRVCGFDTVDSFPPGHQYARTRWNRAYFDIASDVKPEQIERSLCESITNTPLIFAHITHPTPRMQRALLAVIDTRLRRSCGNPTDLVALLVERLPQPAHAGSDARPARRHRRQRLRQRARCSNSSARCRRRSTSSRLRTKR